MIKMKPRAYSLRAWTTVIEKVGIRTAFRRTCVSIASLSMVASNDKQYRIQNPVKLSDHKNTRTSIDHQQRGQFPAKQQTVGPQFC